MRSDAWIWPCFALIIGGQLAWLFAAEAAKKWLVQNDPSFEPPGMLSRMFIGRLFTSFGPVMRYAQQRRDRGEPTTAAAVFWTGFAVSMAGLVGLLVSLASL